MNMDAIKLFIMDDLLQTRSNRTKLKCKQVPPDSKKYFFTNTVVQDWNKLPSSVIQYGSIDTFKNRLYHYLLHLNVHKGIYNVMVAAWY